MRRIFLLLHRYVGLTIATFLIVTGLTGAVISWDHELDEWLNPHLIHAPHRNGSSDLARARDSSAKTPLDYVAEVEARHPEIKILFVPLAPEPGHTIDYWAEPRFNPRTDQLHEVDFNQIFVDPATGEELGRREWGAVWPLTKENFVSFLYKLHFSLHIPQMWGTDHWGVWLLGVVALLWTLDCFVAFYLTLPARRKNSKTQASERLADLPRVEKRFIQRWKPSWLLRTKGGPYKLNFDLHRAGGLWTWLLAFVIAFTGFSMNLYAEVFEPIMTTVSDVTPSIWTSREERPPREWTPPQLSFSDILKRAPSEAKKQGIDAPPGHLFYSQELNIYEVEYYRPSDGHGSGGVGHPEVYFDGTDGRVLGNRKPWTGTAADIFVQAQFPVHSGRILGIPGRILISLMGLAIAMLSVTGVYIWYKKRLAHMRANAYRLERTLAAST